MKSVSYGLLAAWIAIGSGGFLAAEAQGAARQEATRAGAETIVVEQRLTYHKTGSMGTPVRINNQKDLEFIIDTGASLSGIWNSAVQQNGFSHRHVSNARIDAADGKIVLRLLEFEKLNVSALTLHPPVLTEFPDYYSYYRRPLSGILGADFLKNYVVVFDMPRDRIVFYPKFTNLTRKMPGYFDEVPLKFAAGYDSLFLQVKVNGKPVNALLDTGAAVTTLLESEAARLGIDTKGAKRSAMTGINGNAVHAYILEVGKIEAGSRVWKSPTIAVSEFMVGKHDNFSMLFGMDLLSETPFVVDYGRNRLLLAKPEAIALAEAEKAVIGTNAALPQEEGFPCAFPAAALEGLTCVRD